MRRLALLLFLFPAAALAQAPAQPAKPAASPTTPTRPTTPTQRPAAPAAPTAGPATPATKPAAPATTRPAATPATRKPAPAASTAKPAAPAVPAPLTEEQKVIYALGLLMQRSLGQFDLSAAELDILKRALTDATFGKPAIDIDEFGPAIQPLALARRERVIAREKAASVAYLAKAAAEAGATKTASGLVYRDVTAGTGASPAASDMVRVHYRGTLINGTEFDSSYKRNEPTEFALGGVIPCWTEGVQRMKVGGKARLVCPASIAYGDAGSPPIPGGATLIFEVELLEILSR